MTDKKWHGYGMLRASLSGFLFLLVTSVTAGEISTEMPPDRIREAIAQGLDETKYREAIKAFSLKPGRAWAWHALGTAPIVLISTPFSRVMEASAKARKNYLHFTEKDVTQEMLAPEIQVFVSVEVLHIDPSVPVSHTVERIVLTEGNDREPKKVIQPEKLVPIPKEYQNMMGAKFSSQAMMAVFPASAFQEGYVIRAVLSEGGELRAEITAEHLRKIR